jgi:hypothetical protein
MNHIGIFGRRSLPQHHHAPAPHDHRLMMHFLAVTRLRPQVGSIGAGILEYPLTIDKGQLQMATRNPGVIDHQIVARLASNVENRVGRPHDQSVGPITQLESRWLFPQPRSLRIMNGVQSGFGAREDPRQRRFRAVAQGEVWPIAGAIGRH